MKFREEFEIKEQPLDAWQKLVESIDDTTIWKGHIKIENIGGNRRESVLAFRKKHQIERVEKNPEDRSLIINYEEGPLGGFQVFQVKEDRIVLMGDVRLKGIWSLFTKKAIRHILDGQKNSLNRLFS